MARIQIHLLGNPQVELDGEAVIIRRQKILALLVYLSLASEPIRRDHLATLLWTESSQANARSRVGGQRTA